MNPNSLYIVLCGNRMCYNDRIRKVLEQAQEQHPITIEVGGCIGLCGQEGALSVEQPNGQIKMYALQEHTYEGQVRCTALGNDPLQVIIEENISKKKVTP